MMMMMMMMMTKIWKRGRKIMQSLRRQTSRGINYAYFGDSRIKKGEGRDLDDR